MKRLYNRSEALPAGLVPEGGETRREHRASDDFAVRFLDDPEFVPSNPGRHTVRTGHLLEVSRERLQGFVSIPVSVNVINQLQFVHVDNDDPGPAASIAR
jgi:hypothetical protein